MNCNNHYYHNFYPSNSGYGMWKIYNCYNGIIAPHYCHNHTMRPTNWTSLFNHLGTNLFISPQLLVLYLTPTYPINCYGSTRRYSVKCYSSTHNQVNDNKCSYWVLSTFAQNNVINEGNDQKCNDTEVQYVGNGSYLANESTKSLEKEINNGETTTWRKFPKTIQKKTMVKKITWWKFSRLILKMTPKVHGINGFSSMCFNFL